MALLQQSVGRGDRRGSGRRQGRLRHRRRAHGQPGSDLHDAQAARGTPRTSRPDHRPHPTEARPALGKRGGAAARPGPHRRRTAGARPLPVHAPGTQADELAAWSNRLLANCGACPSRRSDDGSGSERPTVTLTINRDTAARFGIQPSAIDATLADAFSQEQVTQFFTQLSTYKVILEVPANLQGSLETLSKLYVKSPTRASPSRSIRWSASTPSRWLRS